MSVEKLEGSLLGVNKRKQDEIARLFRRRVPADQVTTHEFNRELTALSFEIGRQIGVLFNRKGQVEHVIVGDAGSIQLPDLGRGDPARFCGLRFVHTHLSGEPLGDEDMNDLALLRLDLVLAVTVDAGGYPGPSHLAHLLPQNPEDKNFETLPPIPPGQLDLDFTEFITELEREFTRSRPKLRGRDKEGAILVGAIATGDHRPAGRRHENSGAIPKPDHDGAHIDSMAELSGLAQSAGLDVLDRIVQRRGKLHPRTVLGPGKLRQVLIRAIQLGAKTLIFDRELSPAQVNAIAAATELKVVDRSQLILDIFAQRAKTREGKIQVELAQLRYNLPRLTGHGVDMSRLMGGIGGRGPGETKLEVDRRRCRERIHRLERELLDVARAREQKRERRKSRGAPVASIVGYTNAGKSTLLNQLTNSTVEVEDKMFATLDPASRRLRFPRERELIVTDTVGFIHELPRQLYEAFRATLEELEDANVFIHVVDAADPSWRGQIRAVEAILAELELAAVPRITVFNKTDLIDAAEVRVRLAEIDGAIAIAATDRHTFLPLLLALERALFDETRPDELFWRSRGYP